MNNPDCVTWSAQEVKSRMLEAMHILIRLPERGRMQRLRTIWPDDTFARDPSAIFSEQWVRDRIIVSELGEDELIERKRLDRRRRPLAPTPAEIERMNQAIAWPARYLDIEDRRIINRWAHEVAKTGRSFGIAGELGISRQWLNRRILRIASIIAIGLKQDRRPLI